MTIISHPDDWAPALVDNKTPKEFQPILPSGKAKDVHAR